MLSPDNYVQAAGNTQSYNRYSYVWNNPLKFTDPSGDVVWFAPILIQAAVGVITNGISNSMNGKPFFQGAGYAAVTGAVMGYVNPASMGGGAIQSNIGGFAGGAITGAVSGFGSGFLTGAGMAWSEGASFGDGLKAGLINGGIGALTGGVAGGMVGGIDAAMDGRRFWDGARVTRTVIADQAKAAWKK
jgi:hypothetical protein